MTRIPKILIAISLSLSSLVGTQAVVAKDQPQAVEELIIVAIRDNRKSKGATGLDLSDLETPQSLSIIDAETIDRFDLNDINSMLEMTTGINVDATETDRTYYSSRGFDIRSLNVDGVGVPFGELVVGDLDTAIYEKVEVLRGSNGLITGIGNPSGTMNYVRKRPTNETMAETELTLGRWNKNRIVGDISTPLTESGSWAGRFVGVYQKEENWLDHYENDRNVIYGVVDGQLTDTLTLAVGYTRQDNNSSNVLWGALPIIYSDGTQANYDASASNTMNWTFWNTLSETAFAELGWEISSNLFLNSTLTLTDEETQSELFYTYWDASIGLDPDTGLGMLGYPGKFDDQKDIQIWDTSLQGNFEAWGQQHQFTIGISLAESESQDLDYPALTGFDVLPSFPGWTGNEVSRPTWGDSYIAADEEMTLDRYYATMSLAVTNNLKLILGLSAVDYENQGESFGVSTDSTEDGNSPYVGFTWAVMDNLNIYGSYSDIYQPQYYLTEDYEPIGSAQGRSYELGVKKRFDSGILTSIAYFKTEQENLEEFVSYNDDFTLATYRGVDIDSDGFELEVSGNLNDQIKLQAGFTSLEMEEPSGDEARPFIPRKTFKFLGSYAPTWNQDLALGLSVRWQDDIYYDSAFGRISQDAYAIVGGYLSYEVTESLGLSLNFDNLTDKKYLSSVKYEQSYYAEPRSYSLSLDWRY